MKIEKFTDLIAWQKGHELTLLLYQVTETFPGSERFGLTSQMRRSAISITSNLSEGFGRRGLSDKRRFYDISIGSVFELQNQLILSKDVGFLNEDDFHVLFDLSEAVHRLVVGLIRSLRV